MANYSKIKRVELPQSHIIMVVEGNWNPEEWEDIEEVEKGIEKLRKEAEERLDEDNGLKDKTTRDCYLCLQLGKRLKIYLLCKGRFQE